MSQQTVLLVEDEESFIEAVRLGLSREGFAVEVARDGHEALEMFERCSPDIVLLDVMLPKMSGIDVCRRLRQTSDVPIIMVTAKGAEIDTVVGLEVGADDYITKPYRMRELVARMRARAVSSMSCSHRDFPTGYPAAAKKVLAMPPPTIRLSHFWARLSSTVSFVDTFEPPTIANMGGVGLVNARSRASSSAASSGPAQAVGANSATP